MHTTNSRRQECEKGRCSPDRRVWTDPSLRSTPEIWACGHCGREARWRRIRSGRLIFIDLAPPAQQFSPDTTGKVCQALKRTIELAFPIHSHITQANRRRATHRLPSWIPRLA